MLSHQIEGGIELIPSDLVLNLWIWNIYCNNLDKKMKSADEIVDGSKLSGIVKDKNKSKNCSSKFGLKIKGWNKHKIIHLS